jgi:Holliday junction resolvase RusA-like endonuclease
MTKIEFHVPGVPLAKGSMKAFVIHGKPRLTSSTRGLKDWENRIALAAREKHPHAPLTAPVNIVARFVFTRPELHMGTGRNKGVVKPKYDKSIPPKDVDKLARALLDGMTGVVFDDDKRVARLLVSKVYGPIPGAFVAVTAADDTE